MWLFQSTMFDCGAEKKNKESKAKYRPEFDKAQRRGLQMSCQTAGEDVGAGLVDELQVCQNALHRPEHL